MPLEWIGNTAEIQVSLALVDRMRKICTIARHDTYLKNKSGCDINLSGSIQDIRLGEVCRLPDLESIEERAVHRTLFLHVVYGGVVSSEETLNVFCVCFGGDKGDDLMIIGKNGIKTERDLLTLVFKRLGKIKPMVIMGYQARRDMFLMLKRFRYLSGEVELGFAGRFEKGEALKTDICRNEKFKSYPLRQNGSDDAYKFSNVAGVAILDIKEILFRYFREEFMDVFKLDFAWITPKKAEQLMGAGQCETISKWCLKVVKELMKYEETRKLFRFMCGMCFETGWKYTPRTIMDVSVVEIAEAAVYKGKKLTKEGLFRAGDYMILDNQEELSEYAMQSKHVGYSSRYILKFGDCEDVPHTETISDEIGKWKNYVSQKKERICVLKEVRGALAETIVKLKISPEGENLFGKKLEAFERSINLPTTSDNVVQIKEYFKKCVVYTLQVAYGNEIRDRLILETKKRIETYIRESGQQVIAWNIFGTIILKCSDEYVNANGFDVAHRFDKILVCKSLMLYIGYCGGKTPCVYSSIGPQLFDTIALKYFSVNTQSALDEYNKLKAQMGTSEKILSRRLLYPPGPNQKNVQPGSIASFAKQNGYTVGDLMYYCVDEVNGVVSPDMLASKDFNLKLSVYTRVGFEDRVRAICEILFTKKEWVSSRMVVMGRTNPRVQVMPCLGCGETGTEYLCTTCRTRSKPDDIEEICSLVVDDRKGIDSKIQNCVIDCCMSCKAWSSEIGADCKRYSCNIYQEIQIRKAERAKNTDAIEYLNEFTPVILKRTIDEMESPHYRNFFFYKK